MESGRAVQFICVDPETGGFQINQEAVEILEQSEHQIAVISIAGMYRSGKSLLMNLLSGSTEENFEVSSSVDACTRGIWIFSEPITIKKEEEIIDVYFMDSEGLGGVDKTQNHDIQIFTLSLLLSSFFIFNSYGVIDENSLNSLSLVTSLAAKIQEMEDEEDAVHLINHFPSLMWVLRDFLLELKDDEGNDISPEQYLEYVLEENYSDHPNTEEHNAIRATLKRFFPERYWWTLIRPSDDEQDLHNLKSDPELLKPEFVEQINELRNLVLNQINVKTVGDIPLTGADYISVTKKYIDAVNEGAIPKIEDSWAAVVESQLSNGYSRAIKAYEDDMKKFESESIPCNEDDLDKAHKGIMQASIEIFLEVTKGFDNQDKQEAYDTLQENIEQLYDAIKKSNGDANENKLTDSLNQGYRNEILSKEFNSIEEYLSAWGALQAKFFSENDSYKRFEVWCSFSNQKINEGCSKMMRKLDMKKDLKEKQLEVELNKLNSIIDMNKGSAEEKDKLSKELLQVKQEKSELSKREKDLKDEVVAWRELLDSKDEEIEQLNEKLSNLKKQKEEVQAHALGSAPKQNIRKDQIVIEDSGKSATCSSSDCVIF